MAKNSGMGYRKGVDGRSQVSNPIDYALCSHCGKLKPINQWCDCAAGGLARLRYEAWARTKGESERVGE